MNYVITINKTINEKQIDVITKKVKRVLSEILNDELNIDFGIENCSEYIKLTNFILEHAKIPETY